MAEEKMPAEPEKKRRFDRRYTGTRRKDFVRKLAETYDVEAALEEARLTWPQVCELRVRHPDFALAIEEVIAAGYDRLEAMLLRRCGVGAKAVGQGELALAQALLKQRRSLKAPAASATGTARTAAQRAQRGAAINSIMSEFERLRAGQAAGRTKDGEGSRSGGVAGAAGRA